jgi:hypothetical protein
MSNIENHSRAQFETVSDLLVRPLDGVCKVVESNLLRQRRLFRVGLWDDLLGHTPLFVSLHERPSYG